MNLDTETCQALGFRPDGIIDLTRLGLSQASIEARRNFIGGSDATVICGGSDDDRNRLARSKRGLETGGDLSHLIHVQLGNVTEPFILAWAEKLHGFTVARRGERVFHRRHAWMAATLDGWVEEYVDQHGEVGTRVVQCKHVNAWAKPDEVLTKYHWQLQHEINVTGAQGALLLVLIGTMKFEALDVAPDFEARTTLVEAEKAFWAAVQEGRDPSPRPRLLAKAAPVQKAQRLGETSMERSNEWADAAARFLEAQPAVDRFEQAKADLKALVPPTTKRASGHGVQATASAAGAITIKPLKEESLAA